MSNATGLLGDRADLLRIVEQVLELPSAGHAASCELATTILDALEPHLSAALAVEAGHPQSDALKAVAAERQRQIHEEGWSPTHDDEHSRGELARAAACYAIQAAQRSDETPYDDLAGRRRWRRSGLAIRRFWPWGWGWWKPQDAKRDLVRAAALLVAEIERLDRSALTPASSAVEGRAAPFDVIAHLYRQREFSLSTFGPGARRKGVCDHIRKELDEIEADPDGRGECEWIDVIILGFDGALRSGKSPEEIIGLIVAKQTKNESRTWPDWRTADPDKAIEHDRSGE